MEPIQARRNLVLGIAVIAAAMLMAGCGPNDRLRDDYMGKPKAPQYQPVQRDEYGNPILPEQDRTNDLK